jgi:hypothetical protein
MCKWFRVCDDADYAFVYDMKWLDVCCIGFGCSP